MAKEPQSTGEQPVSKTRSEIIIEARRIEEAALFSSKCHFESARLWGRFHWCIGVPIVVLSAIASASALAKLGDNGLVAAGISLVVAVLAALATFLNAQDKVVTHQSAGTSYDALLNKVRMFRTIDCGSEPNDGVLTDRLKAFSEHKDRLNESSPSVPRPAYLAAKKGIEAGEGEYAVDKANGHEKSPAHPRGPTG